MGGGISIRAESNVLVFSSVLVLVVVVVVVGKSGSVDNGGDDEITDGEPRRNRFAGIMVFTGIDDDVGRAGKGEGTETVIGCGGNTICFRW